MNRKKPSLDDLAAAEIDDADLQTMAHVAKLYTELDPVPTTLIERIHFGITLDALEAEVAELQRSASLVGVRADEATEAQTVTFTSAHLTVMITITPLSADRARIDGWIAPGGAVTVDVRTTGGLQETVADQDGRFVFDDIPRGLAQFIVRPGRDSRGSTVITPSIET